MSGILVILLLGVLSLIGLVMAVFPRRLVEWTDRLEDKLFNRQPVNVAASGADGSNPTPSRLSSIIVLSTRVVGIFTVALGLFYIDVHFRVPDINNSPYAVQRKVRLSNHLIVIVSKAKQSARRIVHRMSGITTSLRSPQ